MPAIQKYLIFHWVEEPDEGKNKIQSFQDPSTAQETPIFVLLFKLIILGKFLLLILSLVEEFEWKYKIIHRSNKRLVRLTNFEKKNLPATLIDLLDFFHPPLKNFLSPFCFACTLAHCFVSSNSFHGQITQKAVHEITDQKMKIVAIDNFLEQTTLQPTVFEQERP